MEFETQYDEFGGQRGAPPANEECLMWSAGWARGGMFRVWNEIEVLRIEGIEERRMKY